MTTCMIGSLMGASLLAFAFALSLFRSVRTGSVSRGLSPWRFDPLSIVSILSSLRPSLCLLGRLLLHPSLRMGLAGVVLFWHVRMRRSFAPVLSANGTMNCPFPVEAAALAAPRVGMILLSHCSGNRSLNNLQESRILRMMVG